MPAWSRSRTDATAARIVETVPWEEAKFYAAVQVTDESRHVEVYHRYLTEKPDSVEEPGVKPPAELVRWLWST